MKRFYNQNGDIVASPSYTPDGQEVPMGWSYSEMESDACGENQFEFVGNCIDRSAVLILGAVALYLLLSKNPQLNEKIG